MFSLKNKMYNDIVLSVKTRTYNLLKVHSEILGYLDILDTTDPLAEILINEHVRSLQLASHGSENANDTLINIFCTLTIFIYNILYQVYIGILAQLFWRK